MKILILGNGFDIDHALPTSYGEFLTFCERVLNMDDPNHPCFSKITDKENVYFERLRKEANLKSAFLDLLQKNCLLTYFLNRRNKLGTNWIDLECEIKNIVNEFRALEFSLSQSSKVRCEVDKEHRIHQVIRDLELDAIKTDAWNEITLAAMHKSLRGWHEYFSRALELYINELVNKTSVQGISPDIVEFDADAVLSFNYSNTYERIYGGVKWRDAINHIHGIAQSECNSQSHIILGITSDDEWAEKSYVEFEKYYQRIVKQTGMEYTKWLAAPLKDQETLEVVFFGHSIDSSDSDIIRDFICHPKSSVTVFYHDEDAYQQRVANLIKILGKEKLIAYVSGEHPKITFKQQRSHENDNDAGIEIVRDIRLLYHMYSMSCEEITNFLEKIKHRIQAKDVRYFHSQRNAISLFDALRHNKFKVNAVTIEEICSLLPYETTKDNNLVLYGSDEWDDHTSWGDRIDCDIQTVKLVNAVNQANKAKFRQDSEKSMIKQIPMMQTSDDMVDALERILSENAPSTAYWKEVGALAHALIDNPFIVDALAKLQGSDLPLTTRIRFQHFVELYEEDCYYTHLAKEMADWYSEEENE